MVSYRAAFLSKILIDSAVPPAALYFIGAGLVGAQAGGTALSIKIFDKKAARYETKDFGDAKEEKEAEDEEA